MIDAYEQKHGQVEDRSIFSGEIVVSPHLRNTNLLNSRSNRLRDGLLGSLSRSRTFLSLPLNSRQSFCGSVPDLSRNALNDTHPPQQIMSSNISLINTVPPTSGGGPHSDELDRQSNPPIRKMLTTTDDIELRLKSEDHRNMAYGTRQIHSMKPGMYSGQSGYSTVRSDTHSPTFRQTSIAELTSGYMTLIRTNAPTTQSRHMAAVGDRSSVRPKSPICNTSSLHNIHRVNDMTPSMSFSTLNRSPPPPPPPPPAITHYQPNSPSFVSGSSGELCLDVLSKYTIPRVSLKHNSPLTSPTNQRKLNNGNNYYGPAPKKNTKCNNKYEEDASAA